MAIFIMLSIIIIDDRTMARILNFGFLSMISIVKRAMEITRRLKVVIANTGSDSS